MSRISFQERKGIQWYNSLTEAEREYWLKQSTTYIPADAYLCYLKSKKLTDVDKTLKQ